MTADIPGPLENCQDSLLKGIGFVTEFCNQENYRPALPPPTLFEINELLYN
jgi:hypothetical protein